MDRNPRVLDERVLARLARASIQDSPRASQRESPGAVGGVAGYLLDIGLGNCLCGVVVASSTGFAAGLACGQEWGSVWFLVGEYLSGLVADRVVVSVAAVFSSNIIRCE